jgi:gas vesicle protein
LIATRNLLTGVGIGVVVALLVHLLFGHGLDVQAWSVRDPQTGRVVLTGGIVGAVSQLFGQTGTRR